MTCPPSSSLGLQNNDLLIQNNTEQILKQAISAREYPTRKRSICQLLGSGDDPFFSERFVSQNNLKGSQTHSVAASAREGQNLRLG
jgi:hypothetical protein